jgi:hypothetical protein
LAPQIDFRPRHRDDMASFGGKPAHDGRPYYSTMSGPQTMRPSNANVLGADSDMLLIPMGLLRNLLQIRLNHLLDQPLE